MYVVTRIDSNGACKTLKAYMYSPSRYNIDSALGFVRAGGNSAGLVTQLKLIVPGFALPPRRFSTKSFNKNNKSTSPPTGFPASTKATLVTAATGIAPPASAADIKNRPAGITGTV